MKKPEEQHDDLRAEYDFGSMPGGVRGKYYDRMKTGSNLVLLDPDLAKAFPSQEAVNRALRMLVELAQETSSNP